jgi:hypothetical protein
MKTLSKQYRFLSQQGHITQGTDVEQEKIRQLSLTGVQHSANILKALSESGVSPRQL